MKQAEEKILRKSCFKHHGFDIDISTPKISSMFSYQITMRKNHEKKQVFQIYACICMTGALCYTPETETL